MAKISDVDIATALQKVVRRGGWQGMFRTTPLVAKEMRLRKLSAFRVNKVRAQLGIEAMSRGGRRRQTEEAGSPALTATAALATTAAPGDESLAKALRSALEGLQSEVIQRFGISKLAVCWVDGQWQPVEVTRPRSDMITV